MSAFPIECYGVDSWTTAVLGPPVQNSLAALHTLSLFFSKVVSFIFRIIKRSNDIPATLTYMQQICDFFESLLAILHSTIASQWHANSIGSPPEMKNPLSKEQYILIDPSGSE